VRKLTVRELNERHGGVLPPDAVLVAEEVPAAPPPAMAKPMAARGGRFEVLNAFVDVTVRTLSPAEVKVWLVIFRDARADTGTATVSQRSIAERAGLSVRAVHTAVASLVGKGLVVVARRGRLGAGSSSYRVSGVPVGEAANRKPTSGC
jgi:hypothetical protein